MSQFERYFTYEEAQTRIPWVQGVLGHIHLVLRAIETGGHSSLAAGETYGLDRSEDRQTYGILQKVPQLASPEQMIAPLDLDEKKELLRGLVRGLKNAGLVVQDIRRGLVDFPAWKDGREVFLCYELADGDQISHWHELDAGYAGRQEIQENDDL